MDLSRSTIDRILKLLLDINYYFLSAKLLLSSCSSISKISGKAQVEVLAPDLVCLVFELGLPTSLNKDGLESLILKGRESCVEAISGLF